MCWAEKIGISLIILCARSPCFLIRKHKNTKILIVGLCALPFAMWSSMSPVSLLLVSVFGVRRVGLVRPTSTTTVASCVNLVPLLVACVCCFPFFSFGLLLCKEYPSVCDVCVCSVDSHVWCRCHSVCLAIGGRRTAPFISRWRKTMHYSRMIANLAYNRSSTKTLKARCRLVRSIHGSDASCIRFRLNYYYMTYRS